MKKIYSIITIALAVLALSACAEKEPVAPEAKITVVESGLAIPAKGGEAKVLLETKGQVKVDMDATWCTYTIDGDEVTFTAGENSDLNPRYAKVVFSVDDEHVTVTVHQFGYFTCDFDPQDIMTNADAATFDFPYEYSEKLVATTTADWITLTITEDNLNIAIAENKTQATAANRSRKADISWKLGIVEGVIKVEQLNLDFMQPDANWTVSYDGYKDYEGEMYEHIKNDVADPTISGMYYFTYFEKDAYTASKLAMGDYLLTLIPGLKAEADEVIEYYAEYNLTYSDLLYEDSDFEIFDKFADGEYYACVIGFDGDFAPTGHYAVSEFKKESSSGPSGYDKWLGEWLCPHGNSTTKTDTWTFSVKEKNLSYWVTGIEGYTDLKIEALYDETTEGIEVHAQEELGTMTIGTKGECSMGFYGATTAGNLWTPGANPYTIFTATINGDKAQLVPSTLSTDSGDVQPEIGAYIGKTSSGGFTLPKSFNDATRTNVVLTKSGSGGDGGDDSGDQPGTGSDAFNKFIGSWTVTPADASADPWTTRLVQVTPDAEIAAWDWQDWTDEWVTPATVTYSNSKIRFKGGTGVPLADNVGLDDDADPFTIYYMASCVIDGQSYVITSGDSMYDACEGAINASGDIVLTGLDVELSDGGTYTFVDYGIVAIGSDDATIFTFRNEAGEFPVTMKKASGTTSLKSLGNRWNLSLENAVKVDPSHVLRMKAFEPVEMTAYTAKSEPRRTYKFLVK